MYKCGSKHHIENRTAGSRKEKNGSNTGDSKIGLEYRKILVCKWKKVVAESHKQHAWMKDSCRRQYKMLWVSYNNKYFVNLVPSMYLTS